MSFEPTGSNTGELTNLQWKQGTRLIDQSQLPTLPAGHGTFDVDVMRFTDVRWVGGAKIDIPAGANDLHYFVLDSSTM